MGCIWRRTVSTQCFRICLGPNPRNWNRILGFQLMSSRLLLPRRLPLLLQVRLLRPSSPWSSPVAWRRSCRGEKAILVQINFNVFSVLVRRNPAFHLWWVHRGEKASSASWSGNVISKNWWFRWGLRMFAAHLVFQKLFFKHYFLKKKKREFILYNWFVILLI